MDFNRGKTTILPCSNTLGFKTDAAMQVWSLCKRVLSVEKSVSYVTLTSGNCDPDLLP